MEERDSNELPLSLGPASRAHIADIMGNDTSESDKSTSSKVTRVRILGTVIDKKVFRTAGKTDYGVLSVDDGSGYMIQVKAWSINVTAIEKAQTGDMIDIIGRVVHRDEEVFLTAEIIRKIEDPNWETVRELEIIWDHLRRLKSDKVRSGSSSYTPSKIRSEVLRIIEGAENENGIDYMDLVKRIRRFDEEEVKKVLKKLLNQGEIYESRPGKYMK
jgi:DNA polymerase III alpha subunit